MAPCSRSSPAAPASCCRRAWRAAFVAEALDTVAVGELFAADFKLGPVPAARLAETMERELGVLVLMVDAIDGVSGAACRLPDLDAVLINRHEVPGRRNSISPTNSSTSSPGMRCRRSMSRNQRNRAKAGSSNSPTISPVLMPAAVLDRYGPWSGDLVDRMNATANALLVTATAMKWRLVALGRLTASAARQIPDAALRNNGQPLPLFSKDRRDGELPPLFSKPFMEVIALAIKDGQMSARRAADILDMSLDDHSASPTGLKSRSTCEGPMARHRGPVLVDTNVILECWRIKAWRALAGGHGVETVEDCVIETQTGFQRRRPEQQIDRSTLEGLLKAVHRVGDKERAAALVREPLFSSLDPG